MPVSCKALFLPLDSELLPRETLSSDARSVFGASMSTPHSIKDAYNRFQATPTHPRVTIEKELATSFSLAASPAPVTGSPFLKEVSISPPCPGYSSGWWSFQSPASPFAPLPSQGTSPASVAAALIMAKDIATEGGGGEPLALGFALVGLTEGSLQDISGSCESGVGCVDNLGEGCGEGPYRPQLLGISESRVLAAASAEIPWCVLPSFAVWI